MTPDELMAESERLLLRASMMLADQGLHITSVERDLIASLSMTGHGLASLARARMEAEPAPVEYAVAPPACVNCGSPRRAAVSYDAGVTHRWQCVPCGKVQPGVIADAPPNNISGPKGLSAFAQEVDQHSVLGMCGHFMWCLLNDGHWLHPYSGTVCADPPKAEVAS